MAAQSRLAIVLGCRAGFRSVAGGALAVPLVYDHCSRSKIAILAPIPHAETQGTGAADDPFAVEKWLYLLLQHMSKVEAIAAPQAQNKWQEGNAVKWSYQGNLGLGLVQFVFPVELVQIHFLPGASLAALDLLED